MRSLVASLLRSPRLQRPCSSPQQLLQLRQAPRPPPAQWPACIGATRGARVGGAGSPGAAGSGGQVHPTLPPRESALAAALRHIETSFGRGAVMQLGQRTTPLDIEVISTGSLALDHALGVGGLPRGRVVEIYGPESSGKTTLALHVVAEAQRQGMNCCFIDAEHALDPIYARAVGVKLDTLYLAQPDTGEQALEIADTLVRSGAMDVLVIDSVAALVPKAEIEGEMGDQHMALQARLMSQALRKLTASLSRSKTLIIFINQIRSKVGVIFGSPDVTPGGNALKFYASVRLEIRRSGQIKSGEEITGNLTRVKVCKNKLAPPFRVADFEMTYGTGINRVAEAVDLGVTFGLLRKSGAWYGVSDPELLVAVNAALAAPPTPQQQEALSAAAVEPPVGVGAPTASKAGKKASRAAAAAAAAAATASPAPQFPLSAAPSLVSPSTSAAPAPMLALGEPFLQGRERAKEFFAAHPSVAEVAIRLLRGAMKKGPPPPPSAAASLAPVVAAPAALEGSSIGSGSATTLVAAIGAFEAGQADFASAGISVSEHDVESVGGADEADSD